MVRPVGLGAAAVPRLEHRAHGAQQLPVRTGPHIAAALLGDGLQNCLFEPVEWLGRGVRARGIDMWRQCGDEPVGVKPQHDIAEHAPEAQPGVERESLYVYRLLLGQPR